MRVCSVLLIEDNETDAFLIANTLREAPGETFRYEIHHVSTLGDGHRRLESRASDVVLLDMRLPDSDSLFSVRSIIERWPLLPVIVLTGLNDDATAIEAVKAGSQDYIVKEHLSPALLRRSIHYAIERQSLRDQLLERKHALEKALAEVKSLQGLIRICSVCKKVVNDDGTWEAIEKYVCDHSVANFTHTYCPECTVVTRDRTGAPRRHS